MPMYSYEIGLTIEEMVNVESLVTGFPAPKSKFYPFSSYVTLANKTKRGRGNPIAEWRWGIIKNFTSNGMRDSLKTYCTGSSSSVIIRTKTNESLDSQYLYYTCIMNWPEEEPRESFRRIDFVIRFTNLVLTAPPSP